VETEAHPQAAAVLDEFKKFNDVLEGTLKQRGSGSFQAKDASETVEAVINGDLLLTQLHIEDGLLRLGAETVEQRINEALTKAIAEAAASNEEMYGKAFEALANIVDSLGKTITE
jgi:DNA-binding protein YbaB